MEVGKKRIRLRDGAFGPRVQCSMDEILVRFFRLGYYFSLSRIPETEDLG